MISLKKYFFPQNLSGKRRYAKSKEILPIKYDESYSPKQTI